MSLDSGELKFMAQTWGERFADTLIADPRWPRCKQHSAVAAAERVVMASIKAVEAILDDGDDFKPHVKMMSAATWITFQGSMPGKGD